MPRARRGQYSGCQAAWLQHTVQIRCLTDGSPFGIGLQGSELEQEVLDCGGDFVGFGSNSILLPE